MASYNKVGFVSSASPGYKSFVPDVRGPERGERTTVPASHVCERKAARRFCPELNSYPLLREPLPRFGQQGNLAKDLFADTLSRSGSCFTASGRWMLVRCEPSPECFP